MRIFLGLLFMMLGTIPAIAGEFRSALQVEDQIRSQILRHLPASHFMVVVRGRKPLSQTPAETTPTQFPGLPGWNEEAGALNARAVLIPGDEVSGFQHFDVEIIIDRGVDNATFSSLRGMIPKMAELDTQSGDRVNISRGKLDFQVKKEEEKVRPPDPNWIDSLMKYQEQLKSLLIALFVASLILILANGFTKRGPKTETDKGSSRKPAPERTGGRFQHPPAAKKPANEPEWAERELKHLVELAKSKPERLARLFNSWVGTKKLAEAGVILSYLDLEQAQTVLEYMLPSDVDQIKSHVRIGEEIDPAIKVSAINEARRGLLAQAPRIKREPKDRGFSFLEETEELELQAVLEDEPLNVIALVATQISTARINKLLRKWPEDRVVDFFDHFCRVEKLEISFFERERDRLRAKLEKMKSMDFIEAKQPAVIGEIVRGMENIDLRNRFVDRIIRQGKGEALVGTIFFLEDLFYLDETTLRTVLNEIPPLDLAGLTSFGPREFWSDHIRLLSKSHAEVVAFELARGGEPSPEERKTLLESVTAKFQALVDTSVISADCLRAAKERRTALSKTTDEAA